MAINHLSPEEQIGNSVILLAVEDFRKAVKKLSHGKENRAAMQMKKECEEFFRSKHFNTFTNLDGEVLLSMLEKEANA